MLRLVSNSALCGIKRPLWNIRTTCSRKQNPKNAEGHKTERDRIRSIEAIAFAAQNFVIGLAVHRTANKINGFFVRVERQLFSYLCYVRKRLRFDLIVGDVGVWARFSPVDTVMEVDVVTVLLFNEALLPKILEDVLALDLHW